MIRLKRFNVVKIADSEHKAKLWEAKGFKRLPELAEHHAGEVVVPNSKQENENSDDLKQLRERAKELGIPRAGQLGEEKLLATIAEKEAEIDQANGQNKGEGGA